MENERRDIKTIIIILLLFVVVFLLFSIYSNQYKERQRVAERAVLYDKCLKVASDSAYVSRMQIDVHNDGVVTVHQDEAIRDQFNNDVNFCKAKYDY